MFPDTSPVQTISLQNDAGRWYARVEYGSGTLAAFAYIDRALIETVEWATPTAPNWACGGEVEPARASDPDLCAAVVAFLRANDAA